MIIIILLLINIIMNIYIYIYIHTYIHTYIHACMHTYITVMGERWGGQSIYMRSLLGWLRLRT